MSFGGTIEDFVSKGYSKDHECLCTRHKGGKAGFRKALKTGES